MSIRTFTVFNLFERNARLFPNKVAIENDNHKITFAEMLDMVRSLGNGLKTHGLKSGDVIAVLSRNSEQFFLLYGAAAYIGAIIAPINWRLSADEILYIISDCTPKVIFVEAEMEKLVAQVDSRGFSSPKVILMDKTRSGELSFSSLIDGQSTSVKRRAIEKDTPYIICYTAAIAGKPRGAVLSHDNIIACNIQTALTMGLTPEDAHLNILPMYHMIGLVFALSVMHVGGKNVIVPRFDPPSILKLIEQKNISIIGTFPPILSKLLSELGRKKYDMSILKHVYGLEKPSIIKEFEINSDSQFWSLYGQTESLLSCLSSSAEKIGSAGKPGALVDLLVVDDDGQPLEPGKPGEILIRGPMVFQGYWKQPELTRHTFRNDWHHTGDIGRLDEDGYLWFIGPKQEKDLIKSGGENIYPVEIEKVLLEHPHVQEVVVFGVPDEKYGEGIKAVCVLTESSDLSEQELADFVANKIATYKRPRYIEFVSSLPKKSNGSIDKELAKTRFQGKTGFLERLAT